MTLCVRPRVKVIKEVNLPQFVEVTKIKNRERILASLFQEYMTCDLLKPDLVEIKNKTKSKRTILQCENSSQ